MKRRDFLNASLPLALYAYFAHLWPLPAFAAAGEDYVVVSDTDVIIDSSIEDSKYKIAHDIPGYVSTMRCSNGVLKRFQTPIFAHLYNQHPVYKNLALGVGKWTSSAIFINLENGELLKHLIAPAGFRFFGHAVFNLDGKEVYITADSQSQKQGVLFVYDTDTWTLKTKVDLHHPHPHECIWGKDNRIYVIGTDSLTGAKTGVCSVVDPKHKSLLKTYSIPPAAHVIQPLPNILVCSGGSNGAEPQLFEFNLQTGKIRNAIENSTLPAAHVYGEVLSLMALTPNLIAATINTAPGRLIVWDLSRHELRVHPFARQPHGLIKINSEICANLSSRQLVRLNLDESTLNLQATQVKVAKLGSGSHMRLLRY